MAGSFHQWFSGGEFDYIRGKNSRYEAKIQDDDTLKQNSFSLYVIIYDKWLVQVFKQ